MSNVLLIVCLISKLLFGQVQVPSQGESTLRWFVTCLNSNSVEVMSAFVDQKCLPSTKPTEQRVIKLLELDSAGAPFKVERLLVDTESAVVASLSNNEGMHYELKISFQSGPEHRVSTIYMGLPGSQTGPKPPNYMDWKSIPDLLHQILNDTKIPAMAVALKTGQTEQAFASGTLKQDKAVSSTVDHRWIIGSITKSMTATMIARLIDRGNLKWSTTIGEVFHNEKYLASYRRVTLLQLLQHRGGIPQDLYVNPQFLDKAAGPESDRVQMRHHYLLFTLNRPPIETPGTKMRYSHAGYSIAAHMAETIMHKSYESLMTDLVFKPLQMHSAEFGVPGRGNAPGTANQPMGHAIQNGILVPYVLNEPRLSAIQAPAGAGLSLTISDLLKFSTYHLDGLRGKVRLMSKSSFTTLHRPGSTKPAESRYACGWLISSAYTDDPYEGHNGSDGTFRADMALWPERNLAIVAIANAGSTAEPVPTVQAIAAIFHRLKTKPLK